MRVLLITLLLLGIARSAPALNVGPDPTGVQPATGYAALVDSALPPTISAILHLSSGTDTQIVLTIDSDPRASYRVALSEDLAVYREAADAPNAEEGPQIALGIAGSAAIDTLRREASVWE